jgi:hypothetical protein
MVRKLVMAGSLLAISIALGPQTASAVTVGPHSKAPAITTDDSLVQTVQFGYCRYVRRECAERWGWGTRRFYICLERRGCARD